MKTLFKAIIISLLAFAAIAAQTVDEILEKHFAAIGQENLLQKNTFTTKGKIIQGQLEIPFTSYHKRPMNMKYEATFQGMVILSVFDGENGWTINPLMGSSDPVPMTAEEADKMKLQADFNGMFYNYKEKGYTVEFTGTEPVDDIETFVLKLTRTNGDVINTYIDTENYVILKSTSKLKIQGVETESESFFSNYKEESGIINPYSIETKRDGQTVMQMVFDEFRYDVDIPDSLFAVPQFSTPEDSTGVSDSTPTEEKPE